MASEESRRLESQERLQTKQVSTKGGIPLVSDKEG